MRTALRGRHVAVTHFRRPVSGGITLDVRDADALSELVVRLRPEVIVLAAAATYVEECELDPAGTRTVNVSVAESLAAITDVQRCRLVVFSSEYVFAGCGARGCSESDPVRPVNEYGRQKVALESVVRALPGHLICRTSGLFGWHLDRRNFVCQVIDRLRAGARMTVPSDQLITPSYAPSVAEAVVRLVEGGHSGTFHVAGPRILSRVDFAVMVAETFGLRRDLVEPRTTADLHLRAARPHTAGLDTTKVRQAIGEILVHPADALAEMARTEP